VLLHHKISFSPEAPDFNESGVVYSSTSFEVPLALCGIGMAGAIVWSLLPRKDKFEEPGPPIDRVSQPQVFAQLERIAADLDEPVPEEVFLIPKMNALVTDRGGITGFGSRRGMGITRAGQFTPIRERATHGVEERVEGCRSPK